MLEETFDEFVVMGGLVEVLAPFLLEILVHGAPDRRGVDRLPTVLGLERLIEEFVELVCVHTHPIPGCCGGQTRRCAPPA